MDRPDLHDVVEFRTLNHIRLDWADHEQGKSAGSCKRKRSRFCKRLYCSGRGRLCYTPRLEVQSGLSIRSIQNCCFEIEKQVYILN
jgi:hypothetical protein